MVQCAQNCVSFREIQTETDWEGFLKRSNRKRIRESLPKLVQFLAVTLKTAQSASETGSIISISVADVEFY